MPSIDSPTPSPTGPGLSTGTPVAEGKAMEGVPAIGKLSTEAPKAEFTSFGSPAEVGVVRTGAVPSQSDFARTPAPLTEIPDFAYPGASKTASPATGAPKPSVAQESPSVLNAIEGGKSRPEVMQEAGKVMDRAASDPKWAQAHPGEMETAGNLVKQQQTSMMPSHAPTTGSPQQNLDPERGLRQQMTQGGPDRTNTLNNAPGQGGPNQAVPGQGAAVTAAKLDQPAAAPTLQDGLGKAMNWVKENPVLTAAIVAGAAYLLQSTVGSGGSLMGAAKYGAMAWGVAKLGGSLLGNNANEPGKAEEPGIMSKITEAAKSALGAVIPGYGATRAVGAAMDAMKSGDAPAAASAPATPAGFDYKSQMAALEKMTQGAAGAQAQTPGAPASIMPLKPEATQSTV